MKSMRRLINMNKISVVISVKNEADKNERCLEAVFSQSLEPHEVNLVDGHSTDKTVENTKAEFVAFTDDKCIFGVA